MEEMRRYLEAMFTGLPGTPQVIRAKNELWQMMEDKYTELKENGASGQEAVGTVISEFGKLDELADELGIRDYISAGTGVTAGGAGAGWGDAGNAKEAGMPVNRGNPAGGIAQAAMGNPAGGIAQAAMGNPAGGAAQARKPGNTWVIVLVVLVTTGVLLLCAAILFPFIFAARKAEAAGRFLGYLAGEAKAQEIVSGDVPIGDATQIAISMGAADIEILKGEEYRISYECPKNYCPVIEEKDGKLDVKQTDKYRARSVGEITITVPEDITIEELLINSKVGDINVNDITAADFSINQDVGEVCIADCEFTTSDIEENVGDIDIENTALGESHLSNNIGSVRCSKVVFAEIEITNTLGDIELSCPRGLYDIDAKAWMGTISINGKKEGREYSDNSGSTEVRLYNTMGEVCFQANE